MIHIYTGNGKGKTTAAFGLALRASGQGFKVCILQFLKPKRLLCGEQVSARKIKGIRIKCFNQPHPMFEYRPKLKEGIRRDFEAAKKVISSKRYDMVVLDEIINAMDQGFINKRAFLTFLKSAPKETELVLTGRGDISDIERHADYITIMIDKKHPFRKTTVARRGIEY